MSEKPRYRLTCPRCFRLYIDFIPLQSKDSMAIVWCRWCKLVLAKFDYGEKAYDDSHPDDTSR